PAVARSLGNLALCLQLLGRAQEARPHHERSLAMLRRLHGDEHHQVATALNNLAFCLDSLGRPDEAKPRYEQALRIFQAWYPKGHAAVARTLDNLALCDLSRGRPADAASYARKALEMTRRLYGGEHPDVEKSLTNLAVSLDWLDDEEAARNLYEEALALGRKLASPDRHVAAANLGSFHLDRLKQPKKAIPLLEEAILQIESLRRGARGLVEADRAAYFAGLKRSGAFDAMVQAQVALERADEALRYLERGRARSLLDLLERSRFDPLAVAERRARGAKDESALTRIRQVAEKLEESQRETDRLTHRLSLLGGRPDADPQEVQGLARELVSASRTRQDALRERAQLVRELLPIATPASPAAIQEILAGKERMLLYSLTDRRGLLLVVAPAGGKIRAVNLSWPDGKAVTEATVAAAVDGYLGALRREGGLARGLERAEGMTKGDPKLGARLFQALVPREVWKEVRGLDRLYVVPHGPLHRLPFETRVVKPADGAASRTFWLDEGPPLAYGSAGSVFLWSRKRSEEQARVKRELRYAVVALGDPIFSRAQAVVTGAAAVDRGAILSRFGRLAALRGTREEVLSIHETLTGKTYAEAEPSTGVAVLLEEKATKPRLYELAAQARHLHLATHHLVDESERASYSRLALTVPREATPEDDGFLKLIDVLEHWRGRLGGCELVVLSACETNVGHQQKDEGVFAMPLGFLYAGSPAVIASLWSVADRSTAELMGDFYRRLESQEGQGKLEAFTAARRALRRKYPEPFFWAPFVYIGDPR
ncbi:MAG: CHAT domain-containing protein, partial [Planctomycetota bacterium]